jgi:hypothetical protein
MKNKSLITLASLIFLFFLGYWIILAVKGLQGDHDEAETYSALYGLMALYGGVVGLRISKYWGGFKSLIGRAVMFMSLGLLAQEVGQLTYSGYTYLFHQEIPYPSLGDIGFFGSVILYILAAFSLIKALSTKSTRAGKNKFWIALIPILLLSVSYYIFLKGYEFDFSNPVTIFLDFGYPLGQALYISLGLIALVLSRRYLGGVMKPVILFLLLALTVQYVADFTFLYQVSRETWQTAGSNELIYLIAYFVMTLGLIKFRTVFNKLSGNAGDSA